MSWRLRHPFTVVSRWPLQSAVGVITPDMYRGFDGALVNAPTWGVGPKCRLQCIEGDGVDQYVDCGVGPGNFLGTTASISACFWFNNDTVNPANDGMFYIGDFASTLGEFFVIIFNGALRFSMDNGAFDQIVAFTDVGVWHHAAAVYDGIRGILYLDGIPVIDVAYTANLELAGLTTIIGAYYRPTLPLDGRLWDMRLASVPYTRDEVNRIVHEPAPVF